MGKRIVNAGRSGGPDLTLEWAMGGIVAGVDEAGRGPWAGPVCAAAVILDQENIPPGIDDSKKLSAETRTQLAARLGDCAKVGVGWASVAEIDQLNILQATFLAMRRAVASLPVRPDHLLIDGNRLPPLAIPATAVIGGDRRALSIAAASIVAKVARDAVMTTLDITCPGYGFAAHKGYGTAAHAQALASLGPSSHHRSSFAPIKKLLKSLP